ncbi:MAG: hypothetical protein IJS14_07780 [Lentisphaeria bacterium]|nr:hypothetical protein [Lentisphaeria bacterium]
MFRFRLSILLTLSLLAAAAVLAEPRNPDRRSRPSAGRSETKRKPEPWNERRFGRCKIRVRQARPGDYEIRGVLPPAQSVPAMAERFFAALEVFPPSFLEKSRIRYVTFLDDLTLRKTPAGGVASGDTIYLNTHFDVATIYHELFHTFDPMLQMNMNRKWMSFNDRDFVYTGSGFDIVKAKKFRRKKRQENLETGRFDKDFVSQYAMSTDVEDRAETFAWMLVEGPAFLKRVEASPVLKKKMEYIIDLTGRKRLLGKDFWDRHFHPETDSRPAVPQP